MIKAIKGTKDTFSPEIEKWHFLEDNVRILLENFNYTEIRTPIFEETSLFSRGIGENTDIVGKEMYSFTDRSENNVTLKPEMTASVMRSVIEHSMHRNKPLNKYYYISPMFRQERPQAGRLRQFHQFGAEVLGSNSPYLDAEMIIMPYMILANLGLENFKVKINSLGTPQSREKYKTILKEYLAQKFEELSEESKRRFETNILRIFDSKLEQDIQIMNNAPKLLDYLSEEDLKHFETVKNILEKTQIDFEIDTKLVRGLDYYTHTTFEIVSESVGAQSALLGGGRYNLLSQQLGEDEIHAVGFAAGMERILLAMTNEKLFNEEEQPKIPLYVVRLSEDVTAQAFNLALLFRMNGIITEIDYLNRSVKAQMREANRLGAKFTLMVGGEEFQNEKIILKKMATGESKEFSLDDTDGILNLISKSEYEDEIEE